MAKEIIFTKNAPAPQGAYSQAVKANGFIYVSGQIPTDNLTGTIVTGNINKEITTVIDNMEAVLKAAGSGLDKVVRLGVFLVKIEDIKYVNEILTLRFINGLPARTTIQVSRLPKDVNVEIDAVATE
ncbi:MAG: Rid family detoxifying hydrolase [bacterium]